MTQSPRGLLLTQQMPLASRAYASCLGIMCTLTPLTPSTHISGMLYRCSLLHKPRCRGGIIAGDFNAILPEDHRLINKHRLLNAWVTLHGSMGLKD